MSDGEGGAAAALAGGEGAGSGDGGQQQQTSVWTDGFSDEDKGYIESKGWKEPGNVLKSYRDLEKFHGGSKSVVELPADPDDKEAWSAFFGKVGKPGNAADYELPLPEGAELDEGFLNSFKEAAHGANLTAAQAKSMTEWWNGQSSAVQEAQQAAFEESRKTAEVDLRKEWGNEFDTNIKNVDRAAKQLGVDQELLGKIASAAGWQKTFEMFSKMGGTMGEDGSGPGAGGSGAFGYTPAQAKAELEALEGNSENAKALLDPGHPSYKVLTEKRNMLYKAAYPEG